VSAVVGALPKDGGVRFRVWAPGQEVGKVVLYREQGQEEVDLEKDDLGWFQATVPDVRAGIRYRYRFGSAEPLPDPASRYQPEGVGGPSEVVDPHAFHWSRSDWRGRPIRELVIYEMHVGTFTPEGTFVAASERLPELAELGVTAVELMPVAEFSGERNWGYDGVFLFSPVARTGAPTTCGHSWIGRTRMGSPCSWTSSTTTSAPRGTSSRPSPTMPSSPTRSPRRGEMP